MSACELIDSRVYAVLHIEGLSLFIPQNEIDAIENIQHLKLNLDCNDRLGTYRVDEISYDIFYLNKHLQLARPSAQASECVLLRNDECQFGLLCERFEAANREQIQLRSVPQPMQLAQSPVAAFAIIDGRLGCVTTAGQIFHHLQSLRRAKLEVH